MVRYYKIVKEVDRVSQYAVFAKCAGTWCRLSPWYYRKDNAVKYLLKITRPHQNAQYYYDKTDNGDITLCAIHYIENPAF